MMCSEQEVTAGMNESASGERKERERERLHE